MIEPSQIHVLDASQAPIIQVVFSKYFWTLSAPRVNLCLLGELTSLERIVTEFNNSLKIYTRFHFMSGFILVFSETQM